MNEDVPLQQELQPLLLSRKYLQVQIVLSKRYSGGYSVGDHLFPFRTEKLSPTAPMVLHTRGRVGRRQLFYKPLSTDLLREAFFALVFLGVRPYLKMMRPHLNWGHRVLTWGRRVPASVLSSWGSIPQLGNEKMYCICLSRHRALPSKCRRGDASPPGEDAIPPNEDAFFARNEKD